MTINYKAFRDENGSIILAEAGSEIAIQLENNDETIEVPAFNAQTDDQGTDMTPEPVTQIFSGSTRVYGYASENWIGANNTLGMNYVIHNSTRGAGSIPSVNWADMGILFPKGAKMKRLVIKGRTTNDQWLDTLIHVRAHDTDFSTGASIDSSAEVGVKEIVTAKPLNQTNNGSNSTDMHMSTVDLNDYVFENDGDLHLYFKPDSNLTGTRFWYINFFIEFEL